MENAPSNTGNNLPNREQDNLQKDLITFIKNEIKNDLDKPEWFDKLDRMSDAIGKLDNKIRLSELTSSRDDKNFAYPTTRKEALSGANAYTGRLKYSVLKHERYVQFSKNGKLPSEPDKAVDQLFTSSWAVYGRDEKGGIVSQIRKVAGHLSMDLPVQLKEVFVSEVDRKDLIISGLKKTGNAMKDWDHENLTVQLQEVYWNKDLRKPTANSVLSIRVSETVGGERYVTVRGMDPYKTSDERKYKLPKDIAEDFENKLEKVFK